LANLIALAPALDDLQVGAPARDLLAEVHRPLRGAHSVTEESLLIKSNIAKTWHYIFTRRGTPIKQNQQLSARVYALTVEDQSKIYA
jgi:hypothetical protein